MLTDFIASKIKENLPFHPNEEQEELIKKLGDFLTDKDKFGLFLLNGYAGTGKTSIISSLIKTLDELKQTQFLLAPTGRAAKVLALYANHQAFTIHRKIYRLNPATGRFSKAPNLHKNAIFIVDEASMIGNTAIESPFGSGNLLSDLLEYIYSGDNCRIILLGDTAQLPPVGQINSPALEKQNLEACGFTVTPFTLKTVSRQTRDSGILYNATGVRKQIEDGIFNKVPALKTNTFPDFQEVSYEELPDKISSSYSTFGIENTLIITKNNWQANQYSKAVRNQVLYKEDEISTGDLLIINKNNYYWSQAYEDIDFIANGEIIEVIRISKHYNMYGFRFADITFRFLDYDKEMDARINIDSLYWENPQKATIENQKLLERITEDYPEITTKKDLYKALQKDVFYNAVQVKFAYAITCHKAQGGQWDCIFLENTPTSTDTPDINYFRWLYTAITRGIKKLYIIKNTH